jgi:integrase
MTVESILRDFIKERARSTAKPLRAANAIESTFEKHVIPKIGKIGVGELRRDDILDMRKKVANTAGPAAADRAMAFFRAAMRWFSTECKGGSIFDVRELPVGSITKAKERARSRVLEDHEIRLVWNASLNAGTFGAIVRALLLTVQRRNEIAGLARTEIDAERIWTIPAARYKGKRDHFVPLSSSDAALIEAQPVVKGCDFVFPSTVKTPFTGFGKPKQALDAEILELMRDDAAERGEDATEVKPLPHWTLHDLRRPGRTLMSRERIPSEVAERVLGHAVSALEDTYDKHRYVDEKREALEALAKRIDLILNPPGNNVARLDGRRRA